MAQMLPENLLMRGAGLACVDLMFAKKGLPIIDQRKQSLLYRSAAYF